eukprot:scaffold6.g2796.t1
MQLTEKFIGLRKELLPFLGMWMCDTGGVLNRVLHLYQYGDFDHRDRCRSAAAASEEWQQQYLSHSRRAVAHQESTIFEPTAKVLQAAGAVALADFRPPPRAAAAPQPLYELRRFQLQASSADEGVPGYDGLPLLQAAYKRGIGNKIAAIGSRGQLVFFGHSEVGMLNQVIELWRFESAQADMPRRRAERGTRWRRELVAHPPAAAGRRPPLVSGATRLSCRPQIEPPRGPVPSLERIKDARVDELEQGVSQLGAQLTQKETDGSDITTFLRGELQARAARIEELQSQLAAVRAELELTRAGAANAAAAAGASAAAAAAAHAAEMGGVQDRLAAAHRFLAERDELMAQLKGLQEQAEAEKKAHHKRQIDQERKHAQDRDLWRKDTEKAVLAAREEMAALTDERLDTTVKRAILDNENMSQELMWQSRQARGGAVKRLVEHNQELERRAEGMRVAAGVAQEAEAALVAKNRACEKTIVTLLARVEALEKQRNEDAAALEEARSAAGKLAAELAAATQSLAATHDQLTETAHQLSTKRRECRDIKASFDGTAAFLSQCVADARQQLLAERAGTRPAAAARQQQGPPRPGSTLPGGAPRPGTPAPDAADQALPALHKLPLAQREALLRGLLKRLHVEWPDKQGLILPAASSAELLLGGANSASIGSQSPRASVQLPPPASSGPQSLPPQSQQDAPSREAAEAAAGAAAAQEESRVLAAAGEHSISFREPLSEQRALSCEAGLLEAHGCRGMATPNPELLQVLLRSSTSDVRPWGSRVAAKGADVLSFPGSTHDGGGKAAQQPTPRLGSGGRRK